MAGPASAKKSRKKKVLPAATDVSNGDPASSAQGPQPRRSARHIDVGLKELEKEMKSQKRAEQTAFEQAREREIANPTIVRPREAKALAYHHKIWLPPKDRNKKQDEEKTEPPKGKKRGQEESDPTPTVNAGKRRRLVENDSNDGAGPSRKPTTNDTDPTSNRNDENLGSAVASENSEESEGDEVESDAVREDDEDFGVEEQPNVSKRKAEKIAEQLQQGTVKFVSKYGTHLRTLKPPLRPSDDEVSSGADSAYNAASLDADSSSPTGSSGERQPTQQSDVDSDPEWTAMIKRRAQRRRQTAEGSAVDKTNMLLNKDIDKDGVNSKLAKTRPMLAEDRFPGATPSRSEKQTELGDLNAKAHAHSSEGAARAASDQRFIVAVDERKDKRKRQKGKEKAVITSDESDDVEVQVVDKRKDKRKRKKGKGKAVVAGDESDEIEVQHQPPVRPPQRKAPQWMSSSPEPTGASRDNDHSLPEPPRSPRYFIKKVTQKSSVLDRTSANSKTSSRSLQVAKPAAAAMDNGDPSSDIEDSPNGTPQKRETMWPIETYLTYGADGKTVLGINSQRSAKMKSFLSDLIAHELPRALLRVNAFPDKNERPQMFLDLMLEAAQRLKHNDITERLLDDSMYAQGLMQIPVDRMSSVRGPHYLATRDVTRPLPSS
ncbi:uncharacterized protein C8Q71DRAFT_861075 [Rhodofomes roseus]|uniref:Uncharacterized protein n=1 Tax=Rhodofomes roseus TaxID=34475 RepID=A0ABQ8K5C9_9APHY|nr:uncharacterized protein C8Q71DRAFT_861075 [Rhodofomes roseus]KAH9832165.1 hypothetical protein C8Q71DRAFT_861075 [Rhodofomes roseus]